MAPYVEGMDENEEIGGPIGDFPLNLQVRKRTRRSLRDRKDDALIMLWPLVGPLNAVILADDDDFVDTFSPE